MPITALIIFGVILILVTLYIIVYVIYPGSGNNDVLSSMMPLNQKKDILFSDLTQSMLLGTSGSTVMGFFKLSNGDRTVKYANGFTPLLFVDNNWYLEISPAPIGKDKVAARLRVQTNDGGKLTHEFIELPQIPKQKWIFIAILREGRRYDIIYDNKIVASQRLDNYPAVISSPLAVGNKGLDGSVIHVIVNDKRLSPRDIERERVTHVDTNNTVLEDNLIDMSLPGLKLFAQCPSGLPCDPITQPPNNNLLQWKTPYA
jgi:hypothetical protein